MTDDSPIIDPDDPPPSDQYPTLWDDGRRDEPSSREPNSLWDVVVGIVAGYSLMGSSTLLDWVKARVKRKRDEAEREQGYDD